MTMSCCQLCGRMRDPASTRAAALPSHVKVDGAALPAVRGGMGGSAGVR